MDIQAITITDVRHLLRTYSEDGSSSFLSKFSTYQTTRCHIPDDCNLKAVFIPSTLQISIQQRIFISRTCTLMWHTHIISRKMSLVHSFIQRADRFSQSG